MSATANLFAEDMVLRFLCINNIKYGVTIRDASDVRKETYDDTCFHGGIVTIMSLICSPFGGTCLSPM